MKNNRFWLSALAVLVLTLVSWPRTGVAQARNEQVAAERVVTQITASLSLTPPQQQQFQVLWQAVKRLHYATPWTALNGQLRALVLNSGNATQARLLTDNAPALAELYQDLQRLAGINPQPEPPG